MPWGVHQQGLRRSARIGALNSRAADRRPSDGPSTQAPGQAQRSALAEEAADCCPVENPLHPLKQSRSLSEKLKRQDAVHNCSTGDV